MLAKIGELIKEYWNNVMDILGIKKMSADDFANMTLDKLFSGKEMKGAKSATGNVGTYSNERNDIRFQILGEKGAAALDKFDEATHRMDNLAVARQMEEAGKTEKEIRLTTGWERGKDKKWRCEIEDKGFGIDKAIFNSLKGGENYDTVKLTEIIGEDSPLLKAYPQLQNIDVARNDINSKGAYSSGGNGQITINDKLTHLSAKSVLLHEIQHAIQDIEGFARGGNDKMFSDKTVSKNKELIVQIQDVASYLFDKLPDEVKKYAREINRGENIDENYKELSKNKDAKIIWANYINAQKQIKELQSKPDDTVTETAHEQYRKLAGEVESRNVQSRMDMTPEQRRETLLTETEDVTREDQIVMMDGIEQAMSLSDIEIQPITQSESKQLTGWLNKAFGGAVKVFNVWNDFISQNKALQGFKSLDDVVFSQTLDKVNKAFNEQLDKLIKGTLPKGHIFQLGKAGAILKASGIEDLPIELSSSLLEGKSKQKEHPFDLQNVKDLSRAVQNPIAVFDSSTMPGRKVIFTELEHQGKNFVVALEVDTQNKKSIQINDVRSVYPRNNSQIVRSIANNEAAYIDKKRASEWLSKQRFNSAEVTELSNATSKIIKNFENPISDKEIDNVRFSIEPNKILSKDKAKEKLKGWEIDLSSVKDRVDFIRILKERGIEFTENLSHKWGSDYFQINNGESFRVSDHAKPQGYITNYVESENDFRTYQDALVFVAQRLNLEDKTDIERKFKEEVKRKITIKTYSDGLIGYSTDGKSFFSTEETVIDREWRFKKLELNGQPYIIYKFMQYPDGTVYGAVLPDGSMYLNPEKLNANTPIHEHTHLFNQVIQKTNPKLWNRMVAAVKGTKLWNEVKNDPNYANLKTDSQIADEVYSRLTGAKGAVNWQERIAKAEKGSKLAKLGELIKEYWNNVMDILGVKKMSADDFANMTLDKLFSGKKIKGAKDVLDAKKYGISELQYSMLSKCDFDKICFLKIIIL